MASLGPITKPIWKTLCNNTIIQSGLGFIKKSQVENFLVLCFSSNPQFQVIRLVEIWAEEGFEENINLRSFMKPGSDSLQNVLKLRTYRTLKNNFKPVSCVTLNLNKSEQSHLTLFRFVFLPLQIDKKVINTWPTFCST